MNEIYNILICGSGGQGLLTLKKIFCWAAIFENKDFKASELHGLAQKGGSVIVHFRVGQGKQKVFSPLIPKGKADLILGLDLLEAARNVDFAHRQSVFLINNFFLPFFQKSNFSEKDFLKIAKKKSKNISLVNASEICQNKLGKLVLAGVFLLGYGLKKGFFSFSEKALIFGLKKVFPKEKLKLNQRAFELGNDFSKNFKI